MGALVALAPTIAFGQNARPQALQNPVQRSANPSTAAPTIGDPSDLPIGVQQGLADAKRYQELRQRAERHGRAPRRCYVQPNTILTFLPSSGEQTQAPILPAGRPAGAFLPWPIIPSEDPEPVALPLSQPIQSPMALPTKPGFTLRQRQPVSQASPALRQLQQLIYFINRMNKRPDIDFPSGVRPSAPITMPSGGGAIQMSAPGGGGLRLDRHP
ncbi:MAG: hypothetical protein CFK52_11240 [Chloracidobacterium sp. CP2_5A]|nr:MAG: hypothetical protein CFK52_11240 [Chloracidobacterium sp. CP2_5A]